MYGSGGFTSYTDHRLAEQLGGWASEGIPRVKMKVGREPERDRDRVTVAREAIGDDTDLFVDANGAFSRQEAVAWAHVYADGFDVKPLTLNLDLTRFQRAGESAGQSSTSRGDDVIERRGVWRELLR